MGRPKQVTDEQILKVARELFLKEGYSVSTATIARTLGVSEATLFKRFSTKLELFKAAMGFPKFDIDGVRARFYKNKDTKQGLIEAVEEIIKFQTELLPMILRLLSVPSGISIDSIKGNPDSPPLKMTRLVAEFLAELDDKGLISINDPLITAKVILGATHNFAYLHLLLQDEFKKEEVRRFARELIELLWNGIAPEQGERQ